MVFFNGPGWWSSEKLALDLLLQDKYCFQHSGYWVFMCLLHELLWKCFLKCITFVVAFHLHSILYQMMYRIDTMQTQCQGLSTTFKTYSKRFEGWNGVCCYKNIFKWMRIYLWILPKFICGYWWTSRSMSMFHKKSTLAVCVVLTKNVPVRTDRSKTRRPRRQNECTNGKVT